METIVILDKLKSAKFTEDQDLVMVVSNAKYELVKWVVAGVVANGLVTRLLKYIGWEGISLISGWCLKNDFFVIKIYVWQ